MSVKTRRKPKDRTFKTLLEEQRYYERLQLKEIRKQLIQRDGMVCGICGEAIASYRDCTIDHIKPRSAGGRTELSNCQLAHFKCNLKKGDAYGKL